MRPTEPSETQAAPWASSYVEIVLSPRLNGSQCDPEEVWPENSVDLGSLSQEGLYPGSSQRHGCLPSQPVAYVLLARLGHRVQGVPGGQACGAGTAVCPHRRSDKKAWKSHLNKGMVCPPTNLESRLGRGVEGGH